MSPPITRDLIRRLPKTDLHLHLDGSIRLPTLIDLAKDAGVDLPSWTEGGLGDTVFRESYSGLEEYLQGFGYTCAVLQDKEALERVAYELALDNQADGVRYTEVRFAPQLHAHDRFDILAVIAAVDAGLGRAKSEFNRRTEVASGLEPPFEYGIVTCAMRYFDERFSQYFRAFVELHRYSGARRIFALASQEMAHAAARARYEHGLPVVGFDLAGAEKGYPPIDHREAYSHVHRHFLEKTVHAGEDFGPESIFQAITELHADRIGHGTSLFNAGAVADPSISDPERYVENLVQFIANRRITIEVCLTSNQQTNPAYRELAVHPLRQMLDHKLSVTLCTDNRTVSRTTVTDEVEKAVTTFGMSLEELKNVVVYGFKRSFFPGDYAAKRAYVRRCMDYFERVMAEAEVPNLGSE